VAYNPNILRDVLRARSLTYSQLSQRLGIKLEDLERELRREPEPKQGILNDIAKELVLPPFVFFMREMPPLHDVIPDFRSETPAPSAKSKATIESIQFAGGIQNAVAELGAPGAANLQHFTATQPGKVEEFALRARDFFNVTLQDQADAKDARAFYIVCRKKIEDKGIFVLPDSFPATDGSGFCLSHPTHPVIVVNTKQQTRGRRLFTLIHELAHVLMRKSGISDPFISQNATERLCNRFAGSFLVPESYVSALLNNVSPVSDPDLEDVAWAARRLKISQQAAVLRLEQLHLFKTGSHDKWKRIIHNLGNPDFSEKGGGAGGPPPQEKVKLAKYGFQFAIAFDDLLREGRISEINLYRSTGLKPKYQRAYFDGHVAELVGIEGGVVSGVINLESSGA
jgi:Zn-dependent peptidase ImmA (M78 family)